MMLIVVYGSNPLIISSLTAFPDFLLTFFFPPSDRVQSLIRRPWREPERLFSPVSQSRGLKGMKLEPVH